MKFLVFSFGGIIVYLLLKIVFLKTKYKKYIKYLAPTIFILTLGLFLTGAFLSTVQGDTQCKSSHKLNYSAPTKIQTPLYYFDLGNYDYDLGNCIKAISDYGVAISLEPNYSRAYNNRGYTYMRMGKYDLALADFNKALMIDPNYIQALMNRGDIYNYYMVDRNKAIADYNKVLSLVHDPEERRTLSVCGHKLLAQNNGWSPKIYLELLRSGIGNAGCN